ncbi:cellulose-binding domain-containing protein [Micromonospora eburnea]|nr:cellulose-binding domain-containing protein [Micromonospora eburnea]
MSWNGALAPAAQATFGFLADAPGGNRVPAVSCTAS